MGQKTFHAILFAVLVEEIPRNYIKHGITIYNSTSSITKNGIFTLNPNHLIKDNFVKSFVAPA